MKTTKYCLNELHEGTGHIDGYSDTHAALYVRLFHQNYSLHLRKYLCTITLSKMMFRNISYSFLSDITSDKTTVHLQEFMSFFPLTKQYHKMGLTAVSWRPFQNFLSPFQMPCFAISHLQIATERLETEGSASKLGDVSCYCNVLLGKEVEGSL